MLLSPLIVFRVLRLGLRVLGFRYLAIRARDRDALVPADSDSSHIINFFDAVVGKIKVSPLVHPHP